MQPYLNERKCPAQQDLCKVIAACPTAAVAYVPDEQVPLGGRMVFDLSKCDGCGDCVRVCCGDAIEMR